MIQPTTFQVLAMADSEGWQACVEKTREERSEAGQFFTPAPIARCLAGWFHEKGLNRRSLHLLDPGAGGGVLTAAVVDRVTALRASGSLPLLEEITLEAWELDTSFIPALRKNLRACATALENSGIRVNIDLRQGSYIEGAVSALDGAIIQLSAGGQNTLIRVIVEEFTPRFVRSPKILLLGDAANKEIISDDSTMAELGVFLPERGKAPDVLIHDTQRDWLIIIEAVTSHGLSIKSGRTNLPICSPMPAPALSS